MASCEKMERTEPFQLLTLRLIELILLMRYKLKMETGNLLQDVSVFQI